MKKIIGILLALCFVLSVTAAAASAHENEHGKEKKFGEHHKNKHFHPGHWEKHKVGHREFEHSQWMTVFVYEEVYTNGFWCEEEDEDEE